jgi:ammonia channel protein AmtB
VPQGIVVVVVVVVVVYIYIFFGFSNAFPSIHPSFFSDFLSFLLSPLAGYQTWRDEVVGGIVAAFVMFPLTVALDSFLCGSMPDRVREEACLFVFLLLLLLNRFSFCMSLICC